MLILLLRFLFNNNVSFTSCHLYISRKAMEKGRLKYSINWKLTHKKNWCQLPKKQSHSQPQYTFLPFKSYLVRFSLKFSIIYILLYFFAKKHRSLQLGHISISLLICSHQRIRQFYSFLARISTKSSETHRE